MELIGLIFVTFAIWNLGDNVLKLAKVLNGDMHDFSKLKPLKVYFLSAGDDAPVIFIGRDKFELNAYEEHLVRENLGESEAGNKVKVSLDDEQMLKLVHFKLYPQYYGGHYH